MNPQSLYLIDPLMLTFDAEISNRIELPNGYLGVILAETYFFPTGGGQLHDTGMIGNARVVDVVKSDDGQSVIHVLDSEPGDGKLKAVIDEERRIRHMQHHTAQHLVSGCFDQALNLETISSSVRGYEPTTIDLPDTDIKRVDLEWIENLANQILFENRDVKSYFVPAAEINTIPLRRPPKVTDDIRIVEIDQFDYAACGATHCQQTGMIGSVKIIRTERINQKTRIHFVAGIQALSYFRQYQHVATSIAESFSTHVGDVLDLVKKQTSQLYQAEKELQGLKQAYCSLQAQEMIAHAEHIGKHKVIIKKFENRPVKEVRTLGDVMKEQDRLVTLLATYDGSKLVLVTTCGAESGFSARDLLNQQLSKINGRGGGDERIAQGGGVATQEQFVNFFDRTVEFFK
jgi:alanyl-tRNA synthetase